MCVLDPIRLVITNYPDDKVEMLRAARHPQRDELGERELPFTRELWIEREDFRESANKKYKRLVLGKKVRLRNAYVVTADEVVKEASGEISEVRCSYDPATLGENPADGIKPRGVIHWVSVSHGKRARVRVYDRLFSVPDPVAAGGDFVDYINPEA